MGINLSFVCLVDTDFLCAAMDLEPRLGDQATYSAPWPCRGADLIILIIEFIIPADKHAVRPPAPRTPPALSAPSEPNPKVDPQLTSATRDAAPKGGGLLQSFGITGGMQDDHVTAATFLETGTLHVHLARGRSNWEACVRCPSAALRPDVMIVHASRALTGECDGAQTGRPQW